MVSSSKELSFRWFAFLSARDEQVELDGLGFLKARCNVSSIAPAFDETWSETSSSNEKRNKDKNPQWFFDVDDAVAPDVQSHPSDEDLLDSKGWNEKDDAMLDRLLNDCGGDDTVDKIPDLQWSMSFEEPSWEFADQFSFPTKSQQQETYVSQEFRWNEAKFYGMDEAFTAASTESGSNFTEYYEDDLSTLTPISGLDTVETTTDSIASEESNNWYRAKIASLFAPKKKTIIKMRPDELEKWPTKQQATTEVEAPLLVQVKQVSPQELTRRMDVMQERQEKHAEIEYLANSKDPALRQHAQDQLKELWVTAYKKKRTNSGLGFADNLCYV